MDVKLSNAFYHPKHDTNNADIARISVITMIFQTITL